MPTARSSVSGLTGRAGGSGLRAGGGGSGVTYGVSAWPAPVAASSITGVSGFSADPVDTAVPLPAGYTPLANDVVCITCVAASGGTRRISTFGGWTAVADTAATFSGHVSLGYRVLAGGEANLGTVRVTGVATSSLAFTISIWRNVDTASPFIGSFAANEADFNTVNLGAVTGGGAEPGTEVYHFGLNTVVGGASWPNSDIGGAELGETSAAVYWQSVGEFVVRRNRTSFAKTVGQGASNALSKGSSSGNFRGCRFALRPADLAPSGDTAVSIVGVSSTADPAASTSMSLPVGSQAGDVIVVAANPGGSTLGVRPATPSHFRNVYSSYLFWKFLTAADVLAGTVTFAAPQNAVCLALRGVDPDHPYDYHDWFNGGGTGFNYTTRCDGSLIVCLMGGYNSGGFVFDLVVTPNGFTSHFERGYKPAGNYRELALLSKAVPTAGVTAGPTSTMAGGSSSRDSYAVAFRAKGAPF